MAMIHWRNFVVVLLSIVLSACSQLGVNELDSQDINVNGSWKVVTSPNASVYNFLQGVDVLTPSDVWAVGYTYSSNGGSTPLIERWDGTSWSIVPSPQVAGGKLNAVVALASNDVWAVGSSPPNPSSSEQILIEHWDGNDWTVVPGPNLGGVSSKLKGITAVAANDIWAVGESYRSATSGVQTLVLRWNGSTWNQVATPAVGSFSSLAAISHVAANDIWAVGIHYSSGYKTLTLRWNGSTWSAVSSPNLGGSRLSGLVALSANNVWAVGTKDSFNKTLTMRWNGRKWNLVSSPNFTDNVYFWSNNLSSVSAAASNDIWAVGSTSPATFCPREYCPTYYRTLILHYNGSSWRIVPSPSPTGNSDRLFGVSAVSGDEAWAVGFSGANTLTEHYTIP
jgi:hypothetical protein